MVNPGGTGRPALVISARPEPLPPRRSFIVRSPSALPLPKKYTYFRPRAFCATLTAAAAAAATATALTTRLPALGVRLPAVGAGFLLTVTDVFAIPALYSVWGTISEISARLRLQSRSEERRVG